MSFQVTHNSFAITFGSIDDFFFNRKSRQKLRIKSVCKGTEKGEDRERNLTRQVEGCCQVSELYTVISVYYFIFLLVLENFEAIRKKTIGRVTITECKQVTDGMTCVE